MRVELIEGPLKGKVYVLDDLVTSRNKKVRVGRTRASKMQIKDPSVSERHGEFVLEGENWKLRDVGSSNGTTLNGARMDEGELVELKHGDKILFGTDSLGVVQTRDDDVVEKEEEVVVVEEVQEDDVIANVTVQEFLEAECKQLEETIKVWMTVMNTCTSSTDRNID